MIKIYLFQQNVQYKLQTKARFFYLTLAKTLQNFQHETDKNLQGNRIDRITYWRRRRRLFFY